jgi:L-aspartate oxidase
MTDLVAPHQDRVVVVGAGLAGLATALSLAPVPVTVITQARLATEAATAWAQGGIAAALGPDDSPVLHAADTLAAGAGLGEPSIAGRVAAEAAACIEALIDWGISFDREADGGLALGLEAAHSRRRVVHAGGDASGRTILEALAQAMRRQSSITVLEGFRALKLALDESAVVGVLGIQGDRMLLLPARAVVLASGGSGGLYAATTNPLAAIGSGLVLAARAGAILRDLEFVQFHPTAMALGGDPLPLATEAIRGEGAILVNGRGERFMADVPGAELAPRDIVARAIFEQIAAGQEVFLDARLALGEHFARRFPTVAARCRAAGLDPASQAIPVQPAAHYHMGGVEVDARGRTSIPGLWACGEVAATGLHGANRLASNSLLEAVAGARWVAADLAGHPGRRRSRFRASPGRWTGGSYAPVRPLMAAAVGVARERASLEHAVVMLDRLSSDQAEPGAMRDAALAGFLIAAAALQRRESRGAHFRRDHPEPDPAWQRPTRITLGEARAVAADLRVAARHALAKAG